MLLKSGHINVSVSITRKTKRDAAETKTTTNAKTQRQHDTKRENARQDSSAGANTRQKHGAQTLEGVENGAAPKIVAIAALEQESAVLNKELLSPA